MPKSIEKQGFMNKKTTEQKCKYKNTARNPKKHSKKRKICINNPHLCLRSKNTFHQNAAEKSSKLYLFSQKSKEKRKKQ